MFWKILGWGPAILFILIAVVIIAMAPSDETAQQDAPAASTAQQSSAEKPGAPKFNF